jgi:hypothetical protein
VNTKYSHYTGKGPMSGGRAWVLSLSWHFEGDGSVNGSTCPCCGKFTWDTDRSISLLYV